jgi:hypothetical protein
MMKKLKDGYFIFHSFVNEDKGFERCADELQAKINEAEKSFDIVFLSSASFRDDSSAGRNAYFGSQSTILTRKKK